MLYQIRFTIVLSEIPLKPGKARFIGARKIILTYTALRNSNTKRFYRFISSRRALAFYCVIKRVR